MGGTRGFTCAPALRTDVLVIGSGGAALRAALAAAEENVSVTIVTKGCLGKSGATYCSVAEIGAFNVPDGAFDPEDNPDVFYRDIQRAALGMADLKLARILADEAIDAKAYLERCGMHFARNPDGSYMGYRACFSSRARSHVVKDHFQPIMLTLLRQAARKELQIQEDATVTDLIVDHGVCLGAFMLREGELTPILAGSVILAAGGGSTLFRHHLYPEFITGDGYAMAWRAGACLQNLEFLQTGIGLAWPQPNLFGNQLWQAAPRLTNGDGERFIERYTGGKASEAQVLRAKGGHFPFSTRDVSQYLEIAVQTEIRSGVPTPRGNVYLDFLETDFQRLFRENPGFQSVWQLTYDRFRSLGVDLYRERIEVACFAHAVNGGVLIDERGATSLPGLYAAGEIAAGPHGADRLGGNMSLTCMVFGRRAGVFAADFARHAERKGLDEAVLSEEVRRLRGFGRLSAARYRQILGEVQTAADQNLLIVRNQDGLRTFRRSCAGWKEALRSGDAAGEGTLEELLALESRIVTGELLAAAAEARKESRGSHYRSDYPAGDPAYGQPKPFCKGL